MDAERLPPELVRYVFELAARSTLPEKVGTTVALVQVSRTARAWMRPVLYDVVCLSEQHEWTHFTRAVNGAAAAEDALPVRHLSVLLRPPPTVDEFGAVVHALPVLDDVQIPLALVPGLAGQRSVTKLYVSKHGPLNDGPLPSLPHVQRVFIEPFYMGLYPAPVRDGMTGVFPRATHFGMSFVLGAEDVSRDLLALVRSVLALPTLQRVYIRVLMRNAADDDADARVLRGLCCAAVSDARVGVGAANVIEWACPPGLERISPAFSLWLSNAYGTFDMWSHGEPAYFVTPAK